MLTLSQSVGLVVPCELKVGLGTDIQCSTCSDGEEAVKSTFYYYLTVSLFLDYVTDLVILKNFITLDAFYVYDYVNPPWEGM